MTQIITFTLEPCRLIGFCANPLSSLNGKNKTAKQTNMYYISRFAVSPILRPNINLL